MSDFAAGYVPEEYKNGIVLFDDGDYDLKIVRVEEGVSQQGNLQRVVSMQVRSQNTELEFYLVKTQYFNSSMTKFFDCFGIQIGDFNQSHWIGRTGRGHIAQEKYVSKAGKEGVSMKIKYLIVPDQNRNQAPINQQTAAAQRVFGTPQAQPTMKIGQTVTQAPPFEDDLPKW